MVHHTGTRVIYNVLYLCVLLDLVLSVHPVPLYNMCSVGTAAGFPQSGAEIILMSVMVEEQMAFLCKGLLAVHRVWPRRWDAS